MDTQTLRDHAQDVLGTECPSTRMVAHFNNRSGMDRELWGQIVDLGWPSMGLPEEDGGLGLELSDLTVFYEEIGRVGAALPFLSTMLVADQLVRAGSAEQRARWLDQIASGAVAALSEPAALAEPTVTMSHAGDTVTLAGTTGAILDAADARFVLVLARSNDGKLCRLMIEPEADGIGVSRTDLYDRGHTISTIVLDGVSLPADRAFAATAEDHCLVHYLLGLAGEAIGGSDGILAITVEYLKTRHQFGRPIGSFQALKHRVADHASRLEAQKALFDVARMSASSCKGSPGSRIMEDAAAAKALSAADYLNLTRDAIQMHGGIGFTAEHVCHVYTKRAWLIEALAGGRSTAERLSTSSLFVELYPDNPGEMAA